MRDFNKFALSTDPWTVSQYFRFQWFRSSYCRLYQLDPSSGPPFYIHMLSTNKWRYYEINLARIHFPIICRTRNLPSISSIFVRCNISLVYGGGSLHDLLQYLTLIRASIIFFDRATLSRPLNSSPPLTLILQWCVYDLRCSLYCFFNSQVFKSSRAQRQQTSIYNVAQLYCSLVCTIFDTTVR